MLTVKLNYHYLMEEINMTSQEIMDFFDTEVTPAEFGKSMRKMSKYVMENELTRINDHGQNFDLTPVLDGLYLTNKLAELVDPYFDK